MSVTTDKPRKGSPDRAKRSGAIAFPAILMLVGILILLYPVVSTQYNNVRQQQVVREYENRIKELPPATKENIFLEAEEYNQTHQNGPVLDPWLARVALDNTAYQSYLQILGSGDRVPMSQIRIPSIKVDLPVYHGSDDFVLQHGVGHLFGSSMPIGGDDTHAVLTGHTGLTNATLFDNLIKVKNGDAFYVNTYGQNLKYVVDEIRVVLPDETEGLDVVPGRDLITLVTCTPYGINSHRLLVTGHRAPLDSVDQKILEEHNRTGLVWQWWMIAILIVAALLLTALITWVIRSLRKENQRKENLTPHA